MKSYFCFCICCGIGRTLSIGGFWLLKLICLSAMNCELLLCPKLSFFLPDMVL